jgi:VWFA-related protein
MMFAAFRVRLCFLLMIALIFCAGHRLRAQQDSSSSQAETSNLVIKSVVRRVLVDVVVMDSKGKPVHGLTQKDFSVAEDGHPQEILSFDVHDFDSPSISLPPNSPHLAVNNFMNIPAMPERGPLYVILYDLVNMEVDDQIDARQRVLKFIESKPSGTRFAIYVRSDGLYLVQGFTDDKKLLFAALDPHNPKAHVPRVFLLSHNLGYGDPVSLMNTLTAISEFLEGLPGRKNLIWMAGTFPVALYPRDEDPRDYRDDIRAEVNGLTRAQVALYPVSIRGVVTNPEGALTGGGPHMGVGGESAGIPAGGAPANALSDPNAGGVLGSVRAEGSGDSLTTDYMVQKDIARATGGRAFISTNDVAGALTEATEVDGNYYSLSYSPTNRKDDGNRRSIEVKLSRQGYQLSYRRFYFTNAPTVPGEIERFHASEGSSAADAVEPNDTLQPNMKHGAPMIHDLLFAAHVHADSGPVLATPEQMAQLAQEPAYFRTRHKDKPLKPLASVEIRNYSIDYRVSVPALKLKVQRSKPPAFEFAAAAFDADGRMLNGVVNATTEASTGPDAGKPGFFRVRQQLEVPVNAASIRIGVRDKLSDHMGTLEVQLPLAPEPTNPQATAER